MDGPIFLHKNLKLVGHVAGTQRGVVNSGCYTVRAVEGEAVVVHCELTNKDLQLPLEFVNTSMRLAFAVTARSC